MATVNSVQEGAKAAFFDTVADDHMSFWEQSHFQPSRVTDFLRLEKRDVSRIASVSDKSVRYDDKMPEAVRELVVGRPTRPIILSLDARHVFRAGQSLAR